MGSEWKEVQDIMGCKGCKFCDEEALWKRACCTYPLKLTVDEEGACTKRQEKGQQKWPVTT